MRCNVSSLAQAAGRIAFQGLGVAGLTLLSIVNSPAQQQENRPPTETTERRALDALNVDEHAVAERLARTDPRVKELLDETGVRVVSVEPVLIKTESPERFDVTQRQVEVVLFHPEREVGARVIVNLQQNKVVTVTKLPGDQVMMTNDDVADAFHLALSDPEVSKALGTEAQRFQIGNPPSGTRPENAVEGLPVRSPDPNDPCSKHRCIQLLFRRGNDYLIQTVMVDLTAKHVTVEKPKVDRKADHER